MGGPGQIFEITANTVIQGAIFVFAAAGFAVNVTTKVEPRGSGGNLRLGVAGLCVAAFISAPALAEDGGKIVDEVKTGVLAHDITLGGRAVETKGVDINGEILFSSPGFLDIIGAPRPHLGISVNTAGETDQAYFGLTWGLPIFHHIAGEGDALTIYGSLGGAVHDGFIDSAPDGRKKLGSVILFRESAELGYQLTKMVSFSAIVDHISNANLGNHNAGITSAGARVGFKF
jgi:lipid A 3-O-deacylase